MPAYETFAHIDTDHGNRGKKTDVGVQYSSSEDSDNHGENLMKQIDEISEYAYQQNQNYDRTEYPTIKTQS